MDWMEFFFLSMTYIHVCSRHDMPVHDDKQALAYLADALEIDDGANVLPPLAASLAERVGYQRAGLQLLAEMRRRAEDWDAVAGMVEAAAVTAA